MLLPRLSQHQATLFKSCLAATTLYIFYLSTIRIEGPLPGGLSDKFYHALAFFVLAFLSDNAFPEIRSIAKKHLPVLAYGIFIECVQHFLPYRSFSPGDMIADALGVVVYIVTALVLSRIFKHLPSKTNAS